MGKFFKSFLIILPAVIIIFFIVLEILSRSAAVIFNNVMEEQKILAGTVTVEKISTNFKGQVSFENLLWKDERGNKILEIPEGAFKVKIFDVITKNFKTTTIEELTLTDANISLELDKNMRIDFVGHSSDFKKIHKEMKKDTGEWEKKISHVSKTEEELKKIGEQRRALQKEKIEKDWRNFNIEDKKICSKLNLNNCRIEVFYLDRHYLLSGVNLKTDINTDDKMTINFRTGTFGGTMIGRGLEIHGKVDFKSENVPQCSLTILFQEVDPSSLGFGLNIHDKMTLLANFTGPVTGPEGRGRVTMEQLHIPGLFFKNVEGEIFYKDAELDFKNVVADVYDGKLTAEGNYNIDTRYYNIYGHGKNLKTYSALPKNSHLHCDVDLEITINSKGNAKETSTSGSFSSSKGRYSIFKIDSIHGKFKTSYNNVKFYDVVVDLGNYKISTDALSIVDKKLTLSPIKIIDTNGNLFQIFTR